MKTEKDVALMYKFETGKSKPDLVTAMYCLCYPKKSDSDERDMAEEEIYETEDYISWLENQLLTKI